MFKVPKNKRAFNIGPYLNLLNFSSPLFFVVCKFGPCRQTVLTRPRHATWTFQVTWLQCGK